MDRFGFYLVILLGLLQGSGQVFGALTSCEYTRTAYNLIQPRDTAEVPSQPEDGTMLKICQSTKTCCTKKMEQQLQETAKMDFKNAIQTEISSLEYSLESSALDIHGAYSELLRYGEERIKQYFGTVFSNFAGYLETEIQFLFETIRDYLRGRPANIPDAVNGFFDKLFVLLYANEINPRGTRIGLKLRCNLQERNAIQPFGTIPHELGTRLYQTVELSRLLITSLHLGVEVLNSTNHMQLGKKCSKALLEMRYCGTCQGLTMVKPCNSYCLNVMKGCLANFVDIDPHWNDYVTSVINLVRWSMAEDYDLQVAIYSLDSNIIDAIDLAKQNAERIIQEVSNTCTTLQDRRRPTGTQNRDFALQQPSHTIPLAPNPSVPLDMRLLTFVESLDSSRMLYSSLARGLCRTGVLSAATSDDGCWTGESIDRYSEPVANDGWNRNPEVSWNGRELELTQARSLMDKLQHVIESQESWASRQADNIFNMALYSGSGSGSGDCMGDDEDCEGSGTGVMDMTTVQPAENVERTTPDTDFTFEPSQRPGVVRNGNIMTTKNTKGENDNNVGDKNPGGGAAQISMVSTSLLVISLLLSRRWLL